MLTTHDEYRITADVKMVGGEPDHRLTYPRGQEVARTGCHYYSHDEMVENLEVMRRWSHIYSNLVVEHRVVTVEATEWEPVDG